MTEAVITPAVTMPTKIVETALISGVTPSLTIEYIFIGSVVEPGPEVKLAITRSNYINQHSTAVFRIIVSKTRIW